MSIRHHDAPKANKVGDASKQVTVHPDKANHAAAALRRVASKGRINGSR
jgi:hypothetical protein